MPPLERQVLGGAVYVDPHKRVPSIFRFLIAMNMKPIRAAPPPAARSRCLRAPADFKDIQQPEWETFG